jgi:TolB-like protein/class 3 adenylate cyclase/tetratricopeptide (TPR) repeat protein
MERRLTAILAADVVGYSRLMGVDEAATLASLKAHRRELVDGKIAEHRGRIVKLTGDGMLVDFPSVVDAVACSAEIQRGMAGRNADVPQDRRIEFRMGINLGDVIVEGDDIFGDGVNVAARLEGVARPGGISISATVRDHLGDRLDLVYEDMGEQTLKNIARPIRVFEVGWDGAPAAPRTPASAEPLVVPARPSIAVLPFTNMSGDPEQEYFADGLVEDLITNLSKMPGFFVIARNSTFTYKGKAVDIRQVARELGVRYVLEGSVRKAANRVRITGQLVEGAGATHVWAEKFEGAVEDIFDLQDRMVASIVGALEPTLRRAEIERALRKRPDMLDAYDLYLRALPHAYANTPADTDEALRLLGEALLLDPNYAVAHAYAAWCHEQRFMRGGFHPEDKAAALQHAGIALRVGTDDPQALSIAAFVRSIITHDYESAIGTLDRALEMNANSALAFGFSALVHAFSQRYERGSEHARKALRLSPFDPLNYHPYFALAFACLFTGRAEEAVTYSTQAIQANPGFSLSYALLAAAHANLGSLDAAHAAAGRLLEIAPGSTVGSLLRAGWTPQASLESFAAALRKAGLPA